MHFPEMRQLSPSQSEGLGQILLGKHWGFIGVTTDYSALLGLPSSPSLVKARAALRGAGSSAEAQLSLSAGCWCHCSWRAAALRINKPKNHTLADSTWHAAVVCVSPLVTAAEGGDFPLLSLPVPLSLTAFSTWALPLFLLCSVFCAGRFGGQGFCYLWLLRE